MLVQKYGGSSVATTQKIKKIAKNIQQTVHEKVIVVVSAMGKTTNHLISLSKNICDEPNKRELDALLSVGEQQSAALMAMALLSVGMKAISLNGIQAGIKTTNTHGKALIKEINTKKLLKLFKKYDAIVITGFQGVCSNKNITTLGRGGSDTTAVAIASTLKTDCEIYTDVEGVFSINPNLFKNAKKQNFLSYDSALEMASSGSKVLDERAIEIAKKFQTKIYVGKTLENNHQKGTYVMAKNFLEQIDVKNVSVRTNITLFKIQSKFISQIINVLQKQNQNLEMFQTNNEEISFICKKESEKSVEKMLKGIQNSKIENLSRITLVGYGFATHPQILFKLTKTLEQKDIKILSLIQTETTISFLIQKEKERETISEIISLYGI